MDSKYGNDINNEVLVDYFKALINRIFKILPLRQEHILTLDRYVDNLIMELGGGEVILLNQGIYIELINNLEVFHELVEVRDIKRQVFKCIDICKKIINKFEKEV